MRTAKHRAPIPYANGSLQKRGMRGHQRHKLTVALCPGQCQRLVCFVVFPQHRSRSDTQEGQHITYLGLGERIFGIFAIVKRDGLGVQQSDRFATGASCLLADKRDHISLLRRQKPSGLQRPPLMGGPYHEPPEDPSHRSTAACQHRGFPRHRFPARVDGTYGVVNGVTVTFAAPPSMVSPIRSFSSSLRSKNLLTGTSVPRFVPKRTR